MRWSDIMWEDHPFSSAKCARVKCDPYTVSIVTEINEPGLFEVAILNDEHTFVTLPGIHPVDSDPFDDVLRYQTQEEVVGIIRKLESITGKSPLNVYN